MLGGSGAVKHEISYNLILFLQSGEILLANLLSLQSTFIPTNFADRVSFLAVLMRRKTRTDKDKVSRRLEINIEVFVVLRNQRGFLKKGPKSTLMLNTDTDCFPY